MSHKWGSNSICTCAFCVCGGLSTDLCCYHAAKQGCCSTELIGKRAIFLLMAVEQQLGKLWVMKAWTKVLTVHQKKIWGIQPQWLLFQDACLFTSVKLNFCNTWESSDLHCLCMMTYALKFGTSDSIPNFSLIPCCYSQVAQIVTFNNPW